MGKAVVAAIAVGMVASFVQAQPGLPDTPVCNRHLSVDDVSGYEGDAPARVYTEFVFHVTSSGCGAPMEVPFEVSPIDSTDFFDMVPRFGFIRFGAGDLEPKEITVQVRPDNAPEHDEIFAVWIKPPAAPGAVIDKCVGGGKILNDDFGVVLSPKIGSRLHCSE
ncbi:hypothetical protein Ais01nite_14270 [Asanoa ishikariensis]|uniref:Calx-beta domain-containing protein n=1 Tax=Asanoa ishikariensis TaxID=137265 RepID=A0A1H3UIZ9_9ACTN|nr:hypothetical protein [Asanoa ishikariensis]GIF63392.1 hypothetical protein Ais01nite_14270 [Asanoa ishikariensis]SDZ62374.1 hypothetical protein SAMN05421684_7446 [Asanoa ishikariensis]